MQRMDCSWGAGGGCRELREEGPAAFRVGDEGGLNQVVVWQSEKWSESRCTLEAEPMGFAGGWDMEGEREREGSQGQLPGVWPETLTG